MIHNDKRLSHAVLDIAQLLFMALIVIACILSLAMPSPDVARFP